MIETQSFNSNLENSIKRIVYGISNDDFQKYLYAKENEVFASKFYEEMLNELYEEIGSVVLANPSAELIKNFDNKSSDFTDNFATVVDNSVYISKKFFLDVIIADDDLNKKISENINRLGIDAFVSKFTCSDPTKAKEYVEGLLKSSDFIDIIRNMIRSGSTTEEISKKFMENLKNDINNSLSSSLKKELKKWDSSFSGKRNSYNLFNDFIEYMKDILSIDNSIKLDGYTFNDQRTEFYKKIFKGNSISNFSFYSSFPSLKKDELVKEIVECAYLSASSKRRYVKYDDQGVVVYENTHIIPTSVYEKVLSELPDIIDNAMSNYYMFLSGSEVVFSDEDGKKYSFPIDNIHILGLKDNADDIYSYFKQNPVNNYDLVSPKINGVYDFCGGIEDDIDIKLSNLVSILQNNTIDLRERITALNNAQGIVTKLMTTDDYSQKIDLLIYFYSHKYKDVTSIKDNALSRILGSNYSSLLEILEQNSCYFGNGFINSFKNDGRSDIIQEFINKYNYPSYREQVNKKFDSIFGMQEYLTNQYSMLANEVLMLRKNDGKHEQLWKQYFSDHILNRKASYLNTSTTLDTVSNDYNSSLGIIKLDKSSEDNQFILKCIVNGNEEIICSYRLNDRKNVISVDDRNPNFDVEFNDKNRLKVHRKDKYDEYLNIVMSEQCINMEYTNKSLGIFPLANTFVHAQKNEFTNEFTKTGFNIFSSIINVLKIYDKFLYLNHFNFSIDITNLYITDLQVDNLPGIICEMLALNSSLFTLYDYVDSNGKMHFVSIQDADSLVTVKSNISLLPSIVNFRSKEYKTLLGFCESKNGTFSNILTQSHSDFKKKKLSLNRILNLLKEEKLILRYGTSGSVMGNYGNIDTLNEILSNTENLDFMDLLRRNLIGCSNALLWLETVDYDSFKSFVGAPNTSFMENGLDFNNIRVVLYKNILENVSLLVKKIDDELQYKEMLNRLNNYRLTGNSLELYILKIYIKNKIKKPKDFDESYLNSLSTNAEKADYLESVLNLLPNGFLLDSQVRDCLLIREKFNNFLAQFDSNILDNVVGADEYESESFEFIEEMGNNKPVYDKFVEDIKLRYPACFVICLFNKLAVCSYLPGPYTEKVKRVLLDRIEKNNSAVIDKNVSDLMSKKDEDFSLMIHLEAQIESYVEYIEQIKSGDNVDLNKLITLYPELIRCYEQKMSLLSKKYHDYDKINNKKGLMANVKKFVDSPELKQEKIEKESIKLESELKKANKILRLYVQLNSYMNSSPGNININVIDDLFSLGGVYSVIPNNVFEDLKRKNIELLSDTSLDSSIVSSLNSFNLRLNCENEIKKYFTDIEAILNDKNNQLSIYKSIFAEDSAYSPAQTNYLKTNLGYLQNEIDNSVLESVSAMYRKVSVLFSYYPQHKVAFLKDIEKRIEELYKKYPDFYYKDLFDLTISKVGRKLQLDVNRAHTGYRMKLGESLDDVNGPGEIFGLLSSTLYSEIDQIEEFYNNSCTQSNELLESKYYVRTEGHDELIKSKLLGIQPDVNFVDTYINCVINSMNKKIGDILVDYKGYASGTEYEYSYSAEEYRFKRNGIDAAINNLVSSNLIALYRFLFLKKKDGTPLIDDPSMMEEYRKEIKRRTIAILNKRSMVSKKIINLVNSEQLEEASMGKK